MNTHGETVYKIPDQYSSVYQGHERRLRNCQKLEKIKETQQPNVMWDPGFDLGTETWH